MIKIWMIIMGWLKYGCLKWDDYNMDEKNGTIIIGWL